MATQGTPDAALSGGFKEIPGTSSGDPTGWATAQKASIDTTGMGIPKMTGYQTGAQIFAAIESMAKTNSDHGKVWGKFRQVVAAGRGYSNKDTNVTWSTKDVIAVKSYLTNVNNYNTVNPSNPVSLAGYVNLDVNSHQSSGLSLSSSTNTKTTTPVVSVPAQADLTAAAQTAFAQTLGRSASPAEAADFAKKYQDLVLSYGNAKVDAKKAAAFNAPANPIQFDQTGQAPTAIKSTQAGINAVEAPPTASIAASNYAAQQNPTAASAQAAADGLSQFMSMLKGA